jgi:hypothetical protein
MLYFGVDSCLIASGLFIFIIIIISIIQIILVNVALA